MTLSVETGLLSGPCSQWLQASMPWGGRLVISAQDPKASWPNFTSI
jgi:hypothetical protein